jgi:hypothetical protein
MLLKMQISCGCNYAIGATCIGLTSVIHRASNQCHSSQAAEFLPVLGGTLRWRPSQETGCGPRQAITGHHMHILRHDAADLARIFNRWFQLSWPTCGC